MKRAARVVALVALTLNASSLLLAAQTPAPTPNPPGPVLTPHAMPTLSAGVLELLRLEGDFSDAVAKGGGKAFASWFADDGVTLNNGQPAVLGRSAIAASAQWDPQEYQLSWVAEGAQMGPSGDTGFTWGHYEAMAQPAKVAQASDAQARDAQAASATPANATPIKSSGRYITFWKKVHGVWKVALDASADEPPNALPFP
jgi:ketosteroid isomerase-like protein